MTLNAHLHLLAHDKVFHENFVSLTKMVLDCFGKSPILLWFVTVKVTCGLLRVVEQLRVHSISGNTV
jgi:hypothetical protein